MKDWPSGLSTRCSECELPGKENYIISSQMIN